MKTLIAVSVLSVLSFGAYAERQSAEPIKVIEPVAGLNAKKVELGKTLWFEPRLSASNTISCNSCHNIAKGGVDNLPSSIGHKWAIGPINSPTVFNSDLNFVQFWNGRAKDLQEQAAGPIENPLEMAFTHQLAIDTLKSIPQYREWFKEAYGSETITIDNVTDAIATFEQTLRTPNAPFDLWLKGDDNALTTAQVEGYNLFKAKGCTACHSGPLAGGQMYQKMGLVKPFATDNPDIGRKAITGNDFDKFVFKVPTLRNIELTYPYFHDGSVWDLEEAVAMMADLQLGQKLTKEESVKITEFLRSLTGDQPEVTLPHLPPSTNETARPNI
ncbi:MULTISPECIES: cytochrome-c peroxidase [Vibrio]|uniref:Cytochrome B6 n=6 Tax=Vibrio harveyi TaxID=669 RepID=A0A3A1PPQ8_VIBHA|nr:MULTISPECIES: cytochrome-c peroxidase [Vibrio]AIV05715.1 cytochrome B6 [Vibrio harveyi]AMF96476.1 cytochrome B6 [Vibrio harveyi]EKM16498.1 cytochrome c551 peroxidase [Vibrio harveyi]EKM28032.1 cytochrome c551 peroxidase [Vibrio harveyi]EKO3805774.1 cytochrome-c peroxidase [Vibrio harveyi]